MSSKLKILINGAKGRMGHAVADAARELSIVVGGAVDVGDDITSVAPKCDVIVDFSSHAATRSLLEAAVAAKQVTSVIPIVFVLGNDPIGTGLVTNLARPGGNVTGLSLFVAELTAKRVELIKEAVPSLTKVAVLLNPVQRVEGIEDLGGVADDEQDTGHARGLRRVDDRDRPGFGALLRQWRQRRRVSQLDLALAADVSARHVSFLETGRSRPSREMVLRLAKNNRGAILRRGDIAGKVSHCERSKVPELLQTESQNDFLVSDQRRLERRRLTLDGRRSKAGVQS